MSPTDATSSRHRAGRRICCLRHPIADAGAGSGACAPTPDARLFTRLLASSSGRMSTRERRMITIFSADHALRNARTELYGGELVPPHESPERAQFVLDRVRAVGLGEVVPPSRFGLEPVLRVHDSEFVAFLQSAATEWAATGNRGEAIPDCWPARRMAQKCPSSIIGKLGYYAMAGETSITPGTWEAATIAADVALTGASQLLRG